MNKQDMLTRKRETTFDFFVRPNYIIECDVCRCDTMIYTVVFQREYQRYKEPEFMRICQNCYKEFISDE